MTIDKTIDLCRSNTSSAIVKSVLASTKFENAKDVVAKFIIESRTETVEKQVLSFNSNRGNNQNRGNSYNNNRGRGQNFQNNFRGNGYNNNGYNNRNYNNNRNFNNRGNFRGRNNYRNNNYNNNGNRFNSNQNNNPRNGNIYYAENQQAPPPGAQNVNMRQADNQQQHVQNNFQQR